MRIFKPLFTMRENLFLALLHAASSVMTSYYISGTLDGPDINIIFFQAWILAGSFLFYFPILISVFYYIFIRKDKYYRRDIRLIPLRIFIWKDILPLDQIEEDDAERWGPE